MNEHISDESLVIQCRQGNQAAFEFIMNKYKPMVIKKARSMFLVGGETEDLIQEGMVGLFKAVQAFDVEKESSFYTFCKLCVDRQIYSAVTSAGRKKHGPLNGYVSLSADDTKGLEDMEDALILSSMDPEEWMIHKERMGRIYEALNHDLSSFEWNVLRLFFQGKTYAQMTELLNKNQKSVDNALYRIKNKLQKILERVDES